MSRLRPYRCLLAAGLLGILLLLTPQVGQAQHAWRVLKQYLQPEMVVLEETATLLVLYHPVRRDTLRVMLEEDPEADIYGTLAYRRGGNPYRTWIASTRFWNNPDRPRQQWGRYFRTEFLRLVREPQDQITELP